MARPSGGHTPGGTWSHVRAQLGEIEPRPFRGVVYRVIAPRYLRSALASAGSLQYGGRFNPAQSFEALYTALSVDTALVERAGVILTAAGIKAVHAIRTGVLLRIECRLSGVLDLTDTGIRERLRITTADLVGPWLPWSAPIPAEMPIDGQPQIPPPSRKAPSQRLGEIVHADRRFEAILSLSAKDPSGRCLVIFPDRVFPDSSVEVDDPSATVRARLGWR